MSETNDSGASFPELPWFSPWVNFPTTATCSNPSQVSYTEATPINCVAPTTNLADNKRKKLSSETPEGPNQTSRNKPSISKKSKKKTMLKPNIERENFDMFFDEFEFDYSKVPPPVCSCTGVARKCHKCGISGWQSSCCNSKISVFPLPMRPSRPGARLGGRKMSHGVYRRLLCKLASEGYNLSHPVDLKEHWTKPVSSLDEGLFTRGATGFEMNDTGPSFPQFPLFPSCFPTPETGSNLSQATYTEVVSINSVAPTTTTKPDNNTKNKLFSETAIWAKQNNKNKPCVATKSKKKPILKQDVERNILDVVFDESKFDFSKLPPPVCSCTGVARRCHKCGISGWQSSCCNSKMSVFPLPMNPWRPGARLGGRKMSHGVYRRLLCKLASEGHNLSHPVDLKGHWAQSGSSIDEGSFTKGATMSESNDARSPSPQFPWFPPWVNFPTPETSSNLSQATYTEAVPVCSVAPATTTNPDNKPSISKNFNKKTMLKPNVEKKNLDMVFDESIFDFSKVPPPVCSCTGVARKCHKSGTSGWQSSCCNSKLSVFPLPSKPWRPGARLGGLKMSHGVYQKLLCKLASEGHNLSHPVDLKEHWAQSGSSLDEGLFTRGDTMSEADDSEASFPQLSAETSSSPSQATYTEAVPINSVAPTTTIEPLNNKKNEPSSKKPIGPKKTTKNKPSISKKSKDKTMPKPNVERKNLDMFFDESKFDLSMVPSPICSCTGVARQCHKCGISGWQSSCCNSKMSVFPLPMSPWRPGARLGGRKMSHGAYKKLLYKLASEGHDLSHPVDLKEHWAKPGTNNFITIK